MNKRSKWSNIDNKTRQEVLLRDNNKCVLCGAKNDLTLAHIFLSRAHGGRGCKENLITLCSNCHYYKLDNPLGSNVEKAKELQKMLENYLIEKENITDVDELKKELKYSKY